MNSKLYRRFTGNYIKMATSPKRLIPDRVLTIYENAIDQWEENILVNFINKSLAKKNYQGNHWDSVISNYKEFELSDENIPIELKSIFNKQYECINNSRGESLKFMSPHVIDLHSSGFIGLFN